MESFFFFATATETDMIGSIMDTDIGYGIGQIICSVLLDRATLNRSDRSAVG